MNLEDSEPLGVLAEPEQIAPSLFKESRHFRCHLVFLDDYLLAHGSMIGSLGDSVNDESR
jgi:hypothetical protein